MRSTAEPAAPHAKSAPNPIYRPSGNPPRFHADDCGRWYFATREGIDVGPFKSRDVAVDALKRLITLVHGVRDSEVARKLIQQFVLTSAQRI